MKRKGGDYITAFGIFSDLATLVEQKPRPETIKENDGKSGEVDCERTKHVVLARTNVLVALHT